MRGTLKGTSYIGNSKGDIVIDKEYGIMVFINIMPTSSKQECWAFLFEIQAVISPGGKLGVSSRNPELFWKLFSFFSFYSDS